MSDYWASQDLDKLKYFSWANGLLQQLSFAGALKITTIFTASKKDKDICVLEY